MPDQVGVADAVHLFDRLHAGHEHAFGETGARQRNVSAAQLGGAAVSRGVEAVGLGEGVGKVSLRDQDRRAPGLSLVPLDIAVVDDPARQGAGVTLGDIARDHAQHLSRHGHELNDRGAGHPLDVPHGGLLVALERRLHERRVKHGVEVGHEAVDGHGAQHGVRHVIPPRIKRLGQPLACLEALQLSALHVEYGLPSPAFRHGRTTPPGVGVIHIIRVLELLDALEAGLCRHVAHHDLHLVQVGGLDDRLGLAHGGGERIAHGVEASLERVDMRARAAVAPLHLLTQPVQPLFPQHGLGGLAVAGLHRRAELRDLLFRRNVLERHVLHVTLHEVDQIIPQHTAHVRVLDHGLLERGAEFHGRPLQDSPTLRAQLSLHLPQPSQRGVRRPAARRGLAVQLIRHAPVELVLRQVHPVQPRSLERAVNAVIDADVEVPDHVPHLEVFLLQPQTALVPRLQTRPVGVADRALHQRLVRAAYHHLVRTKPPVERVAQPHDVLKCCRLFHPVHRAAQVVLGLPLPLAAQRLDVPLVGRAAVLRVLEPVIGLLHLRTRRHPACERPERRGRPRPQTVRIGEERPEQLGVHLLGLLEIRLGTVRPAPPGDERPRLGLDRFQLDELPPRHLLAKQLLKAPRSVRRRVARHLARHALRHGARPDLLPPPEPRQPLVRHALHRPRQNLTLGDAVLLREPAVHLRRVLYGALAQQGQHRARVHAQHPVLRHLARHLLEHRPRLSQPLPHFLPRLCLKRPPLLQRQRPRLARPFRDKPPREPFPHGRDMPQHVPALKRALGKEVRQMRHLVQQHLHRTLLRRVPPDRDQGLHLFVDLRLQRVALIALCRQVLPDQPRVRLVVKAEHRRHQLDVRPGRRVALSTAEQPQRLPVHCPQPLLHLRHLAGQQPHRLHGVAQVEPDRSPLLARRGRPRRLRARPARGLSVNRVG